MTPPPDHMRLEITTPIEILIGVKAVTVVAEAAEGSFALLPRHIDTAAALVPGLVTYVTTEGIEHFLGVDSGVLVKCGADVRISVLAAFKGDDLSTLRAQVEQRYLNLDEQERASRRALARLEAGAIRHVMEIER